MQYEYIRQCPQAELNAALLQLLAVGTAPGVVWGQLKQTQTRRSSNQDRALTTQWIKAVPDRKSLPPPHSNGTLRGKFYLLFLGVELETLGQSATLRLTMVFPVQIHALCIRNVLLLGVTKQTVGGRTTIIHLVNTLDM